MEVLQQRTSDRAFEVRTSTGPTKLAKYINPNRRLNRTSEGGKALQDEIHVYKDAIVGIASAGLFDRLGGAVDL